MPGADVALGARAALAGSQVGGRGTTKILFPIQTKTVGQGTVTPIGPEGIPNSGWLRALHLYFTITLAGSGGSGAIADGDISILRRLNFFTNSGDFFIQNACGRALYYLGAYETRQLPTRTTWAVTNGTYVQHIPIYFSKFKGFRPDDTSINLYKYQQLFLELDYGTTSDLMTTVGSQTITVTLDVGFEVYEDLAVPANLINPYFRQHRNMAGLNPQSFTRMNFDRVPKRMGEQLSNFVFEKALIATVSGAGSFPWTGTLSDTILTRMNFTADQTPLIPNVKFGTLRAIQQSKYGFACPTGMILVDTEKGLTSQIGENLDTAGLSDLYAEWEFNTGSTPQLYGHQVGLRRYAS